jgi:hypothetical protein
MPIHWSYKSLQAVSQTYEHWQTWLVYPIAFILVMPVCYWLGSMFGHDFIGIMTGIMIAGAINERIVFRIARSYLKKTITRADKD